MKQKPLPEGGGVLLQKQKLELVDDVQSQQEGI